MEDGWIWQLALWNSKTQLHLSALQDCDTTEEWTEFKKRGERLLWLKARSGMKLHPSLGSRGRAVLEGHSR